MSDYDKMSDVALLNRLVVLMGGGAAKALKPFTDANDLREVRLWAWEEHGCRWIIDAHSYENKIGASVQTYGSRWEWCDHDGSRDSIIRAEARVTIIAVLKALEALANGKGVGGE